MLEPRGELRDDYRAARSSSLIASMWAKDPIESEQVRLKFDHRSKQEIEEERIRQSMAKARAFAMRAGKVIE